MDSPLVRTILATLCGYLLIVFILFVRDWYREEFPKPPKEGSGPALTYHPSYRKQAHEPVSRLSQLPDSERRAILQGLKAGILPIDEWLSSFEQSECEILCLGEIHAESTRKFLSAAFFDRFRIDVLLLEATPGELSRVFHKMEAGRDYFPALGADILNILRAVRNRNPHTRIYGIEETEKQERENQKLGGSRDLSMARNFWEHFQPGMRNVILIGGLHCTSEPGWLFWRLRATASTISEKRMRSVRVMGENQDGALAAFIYFLDKIGAAVPEGAFVMADTRSVPPRLRQWFPIVNRRSLQKFDAVIVFRQ
jgi:hypothetical protein